MCAAEVPINPASSWVEYVQAGTGKKYYHNAETLETRWLPPSEGVSKRWAPPSEGGTERSPKRQRKALHATIQQQPPSDVDLMVDRWPLPDSGVMPGKPENHASYIQQVQQGISDDRRRVAQGPQLCEFCQVKLASCGLPAEGKQRWCESCAAGYVGAVSFQVPEVGERELLDSEYLA